MQKLILASLLYLAHLSAWNCPVNFLLQIGWKKFLLLCYLKNEFGEFFTYQHFPFNSSVFLLCFPLVDKPSSAWKMLLGQFFAFPSFFFSVLWPSCPQILDNGIWALCPLRQGRVFDQSLLLSTCALAFLVITHLHGHVSCIAGLSWGLFLSLCCFPFHCFKKNHYYCYCFKLLSTQGFLAFYSSSPLPTSTRGGQVAGWCLVAIWGWTTTVLSWQPPWGWKGWS